MAMVLLAPAVPPGSAYADWISAGPYEPTGGWALASGVTPSALVTTSAWQLAAVAGALVQTCLAFLPGERAARASSRGMASVVPAATTVASTTAAGRRSVENRVTSIGIGTQ